MAHGKNHGGKSHGGLSLMSIFINMIVDLIINRKVNKAAEKVHDDPGVKQSLKDLDFHVQRVKSHFEEWCTEHPEECEKLRNDPELGSFYK